jgi:Domain of unknown function (DUF4203)
MEWLNILIGAALLLFGRRLFWLFVGCVGFIVGAEFARNMLQGQPESLTLLIALGVGLLAAIISIFLQRILVGIAGFFAGGYCLSALAAATLHTNNDAVPWIAFVVGGVLAAMLILALLDPALILISSLAGATTIAQNVPLDPSGKTLLLIVLLVLGIVVQSAQYARKTKPQPPQPAARDDSGG